MNFIAAAIIACALICAGTLLVFGDHEFIGACTLIAGCCTQATSKKNDHDLT